MIICCDIDGVLADVREYVVKYLPHDWKTFFSHTPDAAIVPAMRTMIRAMHLSSELYFVTGRPESNREQTVRWLAEEVMYSVYFSYSTRLLMRPNNDSRLTCEIKMEWFRELRPDLVIDDDPAVVKAATKAGFIVLQVHGFRITDEDMVPTNYLEEEECSNP